MIAEEQLLTAARVLGAHALDRLQSMAQRYPLISEVRGAGLYLGVEIGRRDARDANARAERLLYRCLEAGLSFKLGGGNVVTLCPPLTITRDELDQALDILEGSMAGL
ncbi:aminotransferase class III-fold pyridoxal phosphate-dependent enzyme [Bradyrhizobium guangdongense]|uniref:aminotransferase class III-fold pyridoxal phosphate-dependent enzyme n=1 Tax=Bradyrhizobium guangdongense TaxID=1325090 RepID=UPI0024C05AE6|nr:aminotransferase class III-fold pyridoxal phosphate-dependent enzyme [Bradyrhizobium guangdongense]